MHVKARVVGGVGVVICGPFRSTCLLEDSVSMLFKGRVLL